MNGHNTLTEICRFQIHFIYQSQNVGLIAFVHMQKYLGKVWCTASTQYNLLENHLVVKYE